MKEQQDWQSYARLLTEVGAVGARERRRQDQRLARRAQEREEAERVLKASVRRRQLLEQRVRDLEARAAAALEDASVSSSGGQVAPSVEPISNSDEADRAIDRLTDELEQLVKQLREARRRQERRWAWLLTGAVMVCTPLAAAALFHWIGSGAWLEVVVGVVDTSIGTVIGLRSARGATTEQTPARLAVPPLVGGLLVTGVVCAVVVGFGSILTAICLFFLTCALGVGAYEGFDD